MIMHRQQLFVLGILCLFIIVFAVSAEADDTFTAYGQVTDANGNYVSGANVTMENFAFKTVASTTTDKNGSFAFINIPTENRMVKVIISYTDEKGNTYAIPPEFGLWYNAFGKIFINTGSTQLTNYPPPVASSHVSGLTTHPVNLPSTKPPSQMPLNEHAFIIAIVLGIILLAGTYWLLRKIL